MNKTLDPCEKIYIDTPEKENLYSLSTVLVVFFIGITGGIGLGVALLALSVLRQYSMCIG